MHKKSAGHGDQQTKTQTVHCKSNKIWSTPIHKNTNAMDYVIRGLQFNKKLKKNNCSLIKKSHSIRTLALKEWEMVYPQEKIDARTWNIVCRGSHWMAVSSYMLASSVEDETYSCEDKRGSRASSFRGCSGCGHITTRETVSLKKLVIVALAGVRTSGINALRLTTSVFKNTFVNVFARDAVNSQHVAFQAAALHWWRVVVTQLQKLR